jgi:hypothetical protein
MRWSIPLLALGMGLLVSCGADTSDRDEQVLAGLSDQALADAAVEQAAAAIKGGGKHCKAGLTLCGKSCIDLQTDPLNCGGCGNACATEYQPYLTCSAAKCVCQRLIGCPNGMSVLCCRREPSCRSACPVN